MNTVEKKKRTANNERQDMTFREKLGGVRPPDIATLPSEKSKSNTGTQSPICGVGLTKGHLEHAELQMVLCQEISDGDNCAPFKVPLAYLNTRLVSPSLLWDSEHLSSKISPTDSVRVTRQQTEGLPRMRSTREGLRCKTSQ